jgi:hypothetical protein
MRARRHPNPTLGAVRQRARVAMPDLDACERCGFTRRLSRHHPNPDGEPDRFVVLCRRCHVRADIALGKHYMSPPRPTREARANDEPVVFPAGDGDPLVYVVGAPGTGKSTLIAQSGVLLMGQLSRFDVDAMRAKHTDTALSGVLLMGLLKPGPVLIESSGVNRLVNATAIAGATRVGRAATVVVCHCDPAVAAQRIRNRAKAPLWGDVEQLIRWGEQVSWRLPVLYPDDVWVDTGGEFSVALQRFKAALGVL